MLINRLTGREKRLFVATVTVIGLSMVFRFILKPTIDRWNSLNGEIERARIELSRSENVYQFREGVEQEYERIGEGLKQKGSDEDVNIQFQKQTEEIMRRSGLEVTTIRPQTPRDKGFYRKHVLEVEAEGTETALGRFLYALAEGRQAMNVERMELEARAGMDSLKYRFLLARVSISSLALDKENPQRNFK